MYWNGMLVAFALCLFYIKPIKPIIKHSTGLPVLLAVWLVPVFRSSLTGASRSCEITAGWSVCGLSGGPRGLTSDSPSSSTYTYQSNKQTYKHYQTDLSTVL